MASAPFMILDNKTIIRLITLLNEEKMGKKIALWQIIYDIHELNVLPLCSYLLIRVPNASRDELQRYPHQLRVRPRYAENPRM